MAGQGKYFSLVVSDRSYGMAELNITKQDVADAVAGVRKIFGE